MQHKANVPSDEITKKILENSNSRRCMQRNA